MASGALKKIKNVLTSPLDIVLANGDVKKETTDTAASMLKQLNPQVDTEQPGIEIKKMSRLAQYIFGYQNTLAFPYIKKIYVNEKWLQSLTPDQKRFVLGRALVMVAHPTKFYAPKMIIDLTYRALNAYYCDTFTKLVRESGGKEGDFLNNQVEKINNYSQKDSMHLLSLSYLEKFAKIISLYMHRQNQFNLDTETATTFNCASAAQEVLMGLRKSKNDKSALGRVLSTISLSLILEVITKAEYYLPNSLSFTGSVIDNQVNRLAESHPQSAALHYIVKFFNGIKAAHRLTPGKLTALKILKEAIDYTPGTLHSMPSKIDQEIYSYNLLSKYPGNDARIFNLQQLKLKQLLEQKGA
jgi:hypothetical protein